MAPKVNYAKLQEGISKFNEIYKVDFDIASFDNIRTIGDNFLGSLISQESWDEMYANEFIRLFKKGLGNYVDYKINYFEPLKMFNDYESMVMSPYREQCEKLRIKSPAYGGKNSGVDILEKINKSLKDIPDNKRDWNTEKYTRGELRIRDIKKFIEEAGPNPSPEALGTLISYHDAMERAIENRTFAWRLRHPIKAIAEQFYVDTLEDYIFEKTGRNRDPEQRRTSEYNNAETFANSGRLFDTKDAYATEYAELVPESAETESRENHVDKQKEKEHRHEVQKIVYDEVFDKAEDMIYTDDAKESDIYASSTSREAVNGRETIVFNDEFEEIAPNDMVSKPVDDKKIDVPAKSSGIN